MVDFNLVSLLLTEDQSISVLTVIVVPDQRLVVQLAADPADDCLLVPRAPRITAAAPSGGETPARPAPSRARAYRVSSTVG